MKRNLFFLFLLLLTNCQPTWEYEIEDVSKVQHFSFKNKGRTRFDSPMKVSVEGEVDGDGYIYLRGAEREILPPGAALIRIHQGRNRKTQHRTITLPTNYSLNFVYVPITAKEGKLEVSVEF